MKYWKTLLVVSLPFLYFLKLGMTVVSLLLPEPRWKGDLNSAWEVEASARVRFCCCTARGARAAGRVWREAWRATTEERRVGIDMAAASMGVCRLCTWCREDVDAPLLDPTPTLCSCGITRAD
jgi:hypothetical protein